MASPNYDALSIQLSRFIGDPVAAAATNGQDRTSAQRDNILNLAIRRWLEMRLATCIKTDDWFPLKNYISKDSQAMTSNSVALSSFTNGVVYIIGFPYNTTDSVIVYRAPQSLKEYIAGGVNQYITPSATLQFYSTEGGNFVNYGGTATATIRLTHVQQHTNLSAGGSSDILVPSEYWSDILDLAVAVAAEDRVTQDSAAKSQYKTQQVGQLMSF